MKGTKILTHTCEVKDGKLYSIVTTSDGSVFEAEIPGIHLKEKVELKDKDGNVYAT